MKLKTLHKALTQVGKAPAAKVCRLIGRDGLLIAIAYQGDGQWLACVTPDYEGENFDLLLHSRTLKDYARLETRDVAIAATDNSLTITCDRSRYEFKAQLETLTEGWPDIIHAHEITVKIYQNTTCISAYTPLYLYQDKKTTTKVLDMAIAITGNYYTDLAAAREAGLDFGPSAKNPAKAEVIAKIEAHNAAEAAPPVNPYADLYQQFAAKQAAPKKAKKSGGKLDKLRTAIADGITDMDQLVAITGMKPQGVKAWTGVIQNQGIENWQQSRKAS